MRQWLEKLNDPNRDIYERRYRLLSAISIVTLCVWLIVATIVSYHKVRTIFFLTCDILFVPTMLFTLRTGKIQLGAGGSGIVLVFLMVPFAFFYNGGIHAGAPNWCILALVFITLTVRGKLRVTLLISDIIITAVCYVLSYRYPNLVENYTTDVAYVDSLASLIITGIMISSMFLFQLHVYNQERAILERQQAEIEALNKAQNSFFSSMSHEIRTPVNTIIGLNEMILRHADSEEVLEDAQNIDAAGRMLLQTVNDILEMSKLESGQLVIVNDSYHTDAMLSELVNMIWVKAREKGLDFRVEVDPGLPSVLYGDEVRIKQVLLNVLTNAVKYTASGSVTLSIQGERLEDGQIRMTYTIADTGIGIRKENIPHLFSAFKRVDEHVNRYIEGTGLGLSIVKQLLDAMGGEISVNSIYTQGSTFIIELPQRIEDDHPLGQVDLKYEGARSHARYIPAFTAPEAWVLAVDDTPANLLVTRKLLGDTGVQIDTASSGAEALKLTLERHYDVILMDHQMPEMDGVECLRRIRGQVGGLCRDSRIVALTANVGAEMEALYHREGFDSYVVKPVRGEVLEQALLHQLPERLVRLRRGGRTQEDWTVSGTAGYRARRQLAITVDSSCDLPQSLLRELNIACIPLYVKVDDAVFQDGVETEVSGLIAYMQQGSRVRTLSPEISEYESFFANNLLRANHIIHFTTARSIATAYPKAMAAAEAFDNVTVLDSGHLSSGTGLMAVCAARMARDGADVGTVLAAMEKLRHEISTSFVIDSVEYLALAGRVSHPVKLVSDALSFHPEFQMRHGELRTVRLFWGSTERLRRRYVASILRRCPPADRSMAFLTHVGLSPDECRRIAELAQKRGGFENVYIQQASAAIACNCGPGTFGLLYRSRQLDMEQQV